MAEGGVHLRDAVRLRFGVGGVPAESQGVVIGWYSNTGNVLVTFRDRGTVSVEPAALELVPDPPKDPGQL